MILIGQYDSPFVRRVAVTMQIYGFDYEHRPWSVFGDADQMKTVNPLIRVPTLVTDDGEALVDSASILDWLDELAGPDRALIARSGLDRRAALKICALASGLADKGVSLVYERVIHQRATEAWVQRCQTQIEGVLDVLETDRLARGAWWFRDRIGHADIMTTCALRFLSEAHPGLFDPLRWPALAAHAKACEAMDIFQNVTQPYRAAPRTS